MAKRAHHPSGMTAAEREARAINAQPWEPLTGMVKRRCKRCRYMFARPAESRERRCPDCVLIAEAINRLPRSPAAKQLSA